MGGTVFGRGGSILRGVGNTDCLASRALGAAPGEQRALVLGASKLIEFPNGEQPLELYDLASDPGEHRNLARERPELLRELNSFLEQTWSALGEIQHSAPVAASPKMEDQLRALGYIE